MFLQNNSKYGCEYSSAHDCTNEGKMSKKKPEKILTQTKLTERE